MSVRLITGFALLYPRHMYQAADGQLTAERHFGVSDLSSWSSDRRFDSAWLGQSSWPVTTSMLQPAFIGSGPRAKTASSVKDSFRVRAQSDDLESRIPYFGCPGTS